MKIILAALAAILFFSQPAQAAKSKRDPVLSQREANCKAQARTQHPGIRFIKRRDFVNRCMGRKIPSAAPRKPGSMQERFM
jgi:hypothetical protein